jgi:hypothetical protein
LAAGRGRQPRLAVIDAASVDGRRKLIIIRRDNVEHLLMIGGPTDVVVETNILRATPAAQREAPAVRAPGEQSPRIAVVPEAPNWPPHLEPTMAPRVDRPRLLPEEPASLPASPAPTIPPPLRAMSEPARPQPANDPLMGLAAELSRPNIEPTVRAHEPLRATVSLAPSSAMSVTPGAPAPPVSAPPPIAPDVHLAEMAQRLETALRRPLAQKSDASRQIADQKRADKPAPANNLTANGGAGHGAPPKSLYEDLEQEMASLLGRQPGKT